jgi:hypothetical protein
MKIGAKSLLFGTHQIFWHPFTVFLAWYELYGWPSWKETVCIFIHDFGYIFCPDMDGPCGENHPELGARIADRLFGKEYHNLCLYHSRTTAAKYNIQPSRLCWADKLSIKWEPSWFYILRSTLSGEIKEYRKHAAEFDAIPLEQSNIEWFSWARERMIKKAYARDVRPAYEEGS